MSYKHTMSEAINFDSLKFAKELRKKGFTKQQAEGLAEAQTALINSNLATKQDIIRLEQATKQDIARLEQATRHDIAASAQATKSELIKWMSGLTLASISITSALVGVMLYFFKYTIS